MPVKEEDVPKTAFRARSSRLYELTQVPFGLSNSDSSFCHLMEMCLVEQQFLTLLLYLDNISDFAVSIDKMLDRIQFVFERLEAFNLKIKPPKSHLFQCSVLFLGHVLSAEGISTNSEESEECPELPVPTSTQELHSLLGLASYYWRFIPIFATVARCLHQLIGLTNQRGSCALKVNHYLKPNKTNLSDGRSTKKLLTNSKMH